MCRVVSWMRSTKTTQEGNINLYERPNFQDTPVYRGCSCVDIDFGGWREWARGLVRIHCRRNCATLARSFTWIPRISGIFFGRLKNFTATTKWRGTAHQENVLRIVGQSGVYNERGERQPRVKAAGSCETNRGSEPAKPMAGEMLEENVELCRENPNLRRGRSI